MMSSLASWLLVLVGLSHINADMMKVLSPAQGSTLYIGSSVAVTISITSDIPACATVWSLWLTAINRTGDIVTYRLHYEDRNDYPNSPAEQNVLTDRIPALFQPPVYNVTMYLQCVESQTYPPTYPYIMHDAITPYAELVVPQEGYWLGDPSSVLKWNTYGPSTTWVIWGKSNGINDDWKLYCRTRDSRCIHEFDTNDGRNIIIQIRDAESGTIVQTTQLPTLRDTTFHFNVPQPAIMYPSPFNLTISWSTAGPIAYLQWLLYSINGGPSIPVDPTNSAIPNTGSYIWDVPDTIQMGDQIELWGCTDVGFQQSDREQLTVIKKPTYDDE